MTHPSAPFHLDTWHPGLFRQAAALMAASDPWRTLGIDHDQALRALMERPDDGVSALGPDGALLGFIRFSPTGFIGRFGYIRTVAVAAHARGHGVGPAMLRHVEAACHAVSPHVFLFCSTFNDGGLRFYRREGYRSVGEAPGLLVPAHGEVLLMKTRDGWLGGS